MLGEGDGPGDGVTVTVWEGKSDGAGTLVGMLKWWWEDCPQLGAAQGQARRLEGCEARMKRFFAVGACPGDPELSELQRGASVAACGYFRAAEGRGHCYSVSVSQATRMGRSDR